MHIRLYLEGMWAPETLSELGGALLGRLEFCRSSIEFGANCEGVLISL